MREIARKAAAIDRGCCWCVGGGARAVTGPPRRCPFERPATGGDRPRNDGGFFQPDHVTGTDEGLRRSGKRPSGFSIRIDRYIRGISVISREDHGSETAVGGGARIVVRFRVPTSPPYPESSLLPFRQVAFIRRQQPVPTHTRAFASRARARAHTRNTRALLYAQLGEESASASRLSAARALFSSRDS